MEITLKQADLLRGFVLRKSSTELIIRLRAGNLRKVAITPQLKRFHIGDEVLIGWDYEASEIANIWRKSEITPVNIPEEIIGVPWLEVYDQWTEETINHNFGDMGTFSGPEE
jgi:hypothetical protein